MAELDRELGKYDDALSFARRAMAVRRGVLDSDPSSVRAQRVVGISHEFMGYILFWHGNYRAAADEHRAALQLFEPIARREPHNADRQRLVGVAQENLCECLALSGAAREAVPHCEAVVAIDSKMADADRNDVQASEDLASSLSTLSVALERSHSLRQALVSQQHARLLFEAALRRDANSRDLGEGNAKSLMELATIERELGAADAAKATAAQARTALRSLNERFPQSHSFVVLRNRAEELYQSMH